MSYEHGTTHYNLPQTTDSDTRDWFDTNEAFRVVDEVLYSASQTAGQATEDIESVKTDISDLKDADTVIASRVDGIDSRVTANETKIQRLENATADSKQDLMDAICSIEESSATAAYPHLTGDFFWYNDTLYKVADNIAVGQQIVPDTNCRTTNITTELVEGASGGVEIDDSSVSANKVWSSMKTNTELSTKANSADVYTKSEVDTLIAEIGGGSMPKLNYGTPLHTFASTLNYTVPSNIDECYLIVTPIQSTASNTFTINGTSFTAAYNGGGGYGIGGTAMYRLSAGDTVVLNTANPYAHVFATE